MRELTDREMDAVCGGFFNGINFQNISNRQSNKATVVQVGFISGNVALVGQANGAINTNIN